MTTSRFAGVQAVDDKRADVLRQRSGARAVECNNVVVAAKPAGFTRSAHPRPFICVGRPVLDTQQVPGGWQPCRTIVLNLARSPLLV